MKKEELRIGNLVLIPYNKSNKQEGFFEATISQIGDFGAYIKPEDYEPILLTEEWLLKFGFKIWDRNKWSDLGMNIVLLENGDNFLFLANQRHVNIFYIHQLQNLYFALTGEELTYGGNK
jgi:hypothetical protein